MDTLTTLPDTRWTVTTTARSAYANKAFDIRHGAILSGYGRYTEVGITAAGNVLFSFVSGRRIALLPTAQVHLSIAHNPR